MPLNLIAKLESDNNQNHTIKTLELSIDVEDLMK